jgi:hypothetical protein
MEPCDPIARKGLAAKDDTSTLSTAFRWCDAILPHIYWVRSDVKNNTTSYIKATDTRNGTHN